MDPSFVAAAFGDGGHARVLLELFSGSVAVALCAKGDQEAWGQDGTSAWEGAEPREGGMALGTLGHGVVEGRDRVQGHAYGLTVSPGAFATHCDRFFGKPAPSAQADGYTVFEGRIHALCHTLPLEVPRAAIKAIATTLVTAWQRYIPLDPECLQVLQELHSGYTLGLISNFDHPPHVHQVLNEQGLRQWFSVIVISGEVGVEKPHPQIFRFALEQTGLTPADVVYVGDTAEDVQGARAAGMHPILIRRGRQRPQALDFQVHGADTDAAAPGRVPEDVETISRSSELRVRLERHQSP